MRHASRRHARPDTRVDAILNVEVTQAHRLRPARTGETRWQIVTANAGTFVTEPGGLAAAVLDAGADTIVGSLRTIEVNEARRVVDVGFVQTWPTGGVS